MLIAWRRLPETIQSADADSMFGSRVGGVYLTSVSQSMLSACIRGTQLLANCCGLLIGNLHPRIDVACCTPRKRRRDKVEIWKVPEAARVAREDFVVEQP
jgi:hypothetical protein